MIDLRSERLWRSFVTIILILLFNAMQSKIILGIDPGTVVMGFGLVKCAGDKLSLIEMGVLRLPTSKDSYTRLQLIHQKVRDLIGRFGPEDFAIEAPFFGKNVQSMLKLGRAQGVAIAAAIQAGIPVTEYSPKKVKQSITGNGNSEKEQVWKMLQHILQLEQDIPAYDASDALAVAVCHFFQYRTEALLGDAAEKTGKTPKKKADSWEAFVQQNPGKVKSR
jgi:crossover junction endodeoxyribonuclease RuvC